MSAADAVVFLFDVDNTLIDNDRIQADLRGTEAAHGDRTCARYWEIFQEQWGVMNYADYFGALARLRLEDPYDRGASRHRELALGLIRSPDCPPPERP